MQPGILLLFRSIAFCLLVLSWQGCGSTQQREATEQLLTSDAVDRSIARIDFRALAGETVYFDTSYLKNVKGVGFVNAEYITSSLRQQLVAARCLLRDKKEEADFVVEARIGTLGTDRHEVTYGMPANNFLSAASSLVPNSPPLPTLPELSVAKRNEQLAAAKIGAFAYHRETGEPVWQSGMAPTRSTAKDLWILGAGPIQRGEIYDGTQFAGTKLGFSLVANGDADATAPLVDYHKPAYFQPKFEKTKTAEAKPEQNKDKKQPEKKAEAPKAPEKPPAPKPASSAAEKSEPKPAKRTTSAVAEKPAKPESAPAEAASNPLDPAAPLESGLRLRFHFDQPSVAPLSEPAAQEPRLFRLDPPEPIAVP